MKWSKFKMVSVFMAVMLLPSIVFAGESLVMRLLENPQVIELIIAAVVGLLGFLKVSKDTQRQIDEILHLYGPKVVRTVKQLADHVDDVTGEIDVNGVAEDARSALRGVMKDDAHERLAAHIPKHLHAIAKITGTDIGSRVESVVESAVNELRTVEHAMKEMAVTEGKN